MGLEAIIFGGLETLVETADLQRQAYNQAFAAAGLSWFWDPESFTKLLAIPGGQKRLEHFNTFVAKNHDLTEDDLTALQADQSAFFQRSLQSAELKPRPGVLRLIHEAKKIDLKIGLASTSSLADIRHLSIAARLNLNWFDAVLHRLMVNHPKPCPNVYRRCLEIISVRPVNAVAIEDSGFGVAAAVAAHVLCVAVPGCYTRDQSFESAAAVLSSLGDSNTPALSLRLSSRSSPNIVDASYLSDLLERQSKLNK